MFTTSNRVFMEIEFFMKIVKIKLKLNFFHISDYNMHFVRYFISFYI